MPRFLTSSANSHGEAVKRATAEGLVEGSKAFATRVMQIRSELNAQKAGRRRSRRSKSRARKTRRH